MLKKLYYWLHDKFSKPEERGEYSAGHWQDAVRSKVLELCPKEDSNILEIGCGEGLFLAKLAKERKNLKVFGFDIWMKILERAKERLRGIKGMDLLQADAVSIPFKDSSLKNVACINVFFNLPSDEHVRRSLKEIARVLEDEGNLFFDIRNSANPLLYLKYKLAKYYDETVKDLPLRTFKLKKICSYLKESGFEVKKTISMGFPENFLAPIFVIHAQRKKQ